MSMNIEVILCPAEFPALAARDLSATTCIVFDVLRATSSMLTALNNGAEEIIPVVEIAEALAVKQQRPEVMLAGERHGLRIAREQTGGVDFDFGNSPRDFAPENVRGKTIAWTTTNGTRALRACAHAEMVLLGGLLNLDALKDVIEQLRPKNLLMVCAGTFELPAFEDIFAAGALVDELAQELPPAWPTVRPAWTTAASGNALSPPARSTPGVCWRILTSPPTWPCASPTPGCRSTPR
jgi:2-phosphosulfolactate phosphatase